MPEPRTVALRRSNCRRLPSRAIGRVIWGADSVGRWGIVPGGTPVVMLGLPSGLRVLRRLSGQGAF
ncbi:MAG: hypothetical protein U1E67_00185 [Hyphomicrobiales bacterium]